MENSIACAVKLRLEGVSSLNERVREQLTELVKTHGVDILDQPDKIETLLKTSFGESETEIKAIVTALREGLLSELLRSKDSSAQTAAMKRLFLTT
ncbi:hypothetical protein [Mesotoga sp.]|uniref:hypothetical protein n=1 Tax=Mesotoga sp. TaxID=2053577 RepID=UPI00345E9E2E